MSEGRTDAGSGEETPPTTSSRTGLGERLGAQAVRLRLLVTHLASRAILARVEPEDVVQDVFVRALGRPERIPPPSADEIELRRYLNRIARHTVIDVARALRTAKRDGQVRTLARGDWSQAASSPHGPTASQLVAPGPGPHTALVAREGIRGLEQAFLRLRPDHRRVLGLRQFEGLSAREAARRTGRSETSIHSLYRRALLAWERELGESDDSRDESAPRARSERP